MSCIPQISSQIIIILLFLTCTATASIIDCDNCADCNQKIQTAAPGDVVRLIEDILGCDGTCIDFDGKDNVTFDGHGHLIKGIDNYNAYGVYLGSHSDNNSVINCIITDFRYGIYVYGSDNTAIRGTVANSNVGAGVAVLYGTGNMLTDCVLDGNSHFDFHFVPNLPTDCETCLTNVTGSGGRQIAFYNQTVDLQDMEFSALYLCTADGSVLDNITIRGSDTRKNDGMRVYCTNNATITNITSSNNFCGILLDDSDNNDLSYAICNNNNHYNIHLRYASNNVLERVMTCASPQCGIYLYHSPSNRITRATALSNMIGINFDKSPYTVLNDSHILNSMVNGLSVGRYSEGNLIYNNYFSNTRNVNFVGGDLIYKNFWNATRIAGPNLIGGAEIGGNYWSDYAGTDADGDGFGDTPYNVNGTGVYNIDYLPMVRALCGDVDCNGYVSANDVVEAYRSAVDPDYLLPSVWAADVDGNGYISANDVIEIYRKAVDPEHQLNCIQFTELEV